MNTSHPNIDSLDAIIHISALQITAVEFNKKNNTLLVTLNTGSTIETELTLTPRLTMASNEALQQYNIIANGTGIHWPLIDEDLSLKSILRSAIQHQLTHPKHLTIH